MAGKLFIGFDISRSANALMPNASLLGNGWQASQVWTDTALPAGVYHNSGAATQNRNSFGPSGGGNFTDVSAVYGPPATGSVGMSIGDTSATGWKATSPTRATYQASKGHQIGIVRSIAGLSSAEYFITFDIYTAQFGSIDRTSGWEPADVWNYLFSWGDVSVRMKSSIGDPGTIVFSIKNGATEVATTTLASFTRTTWLFCKLRVKLDATTGMVDFSVNGVAQSTPVTGINTVTTTSLASATIIYIGPPILDSGTVIISGHLDNIYIDDAAFPAGRPATSSFALASDSTLTDMVAFGPGATTVTDALSNPGDTKAVRASVAGGSAVVNTTPPTTTTFLTDILGVELVAQGAANRNGTTDRRLEIGYDLSGVQTMGTKAKGTPLIFDSAVNPPTPSGQRTQPLEQIFETSAAAKMTKTELATMKIVLKSTDSLILDSDVLVWRSAVETADGAVLSSNTVNLANNLVQGLKTDGLWPFITNLYLVAGPATLAGGNIKMKGSGASVLMNFVGGDHNRLTGRKGDGSSKYVKTGLLRSGIPLNENHIYVSASDLENTGANRCVLGSYSGGSGDDIVSLLPQVTNLGRSYRAGALAFIPTGGPADCGLSGSRESNSILKLYQNGIVVNTNTASTVSALSSTEFFMHAESQGTTPTSFSAARLRVVSVGDGLSEAQMLLLHNRVVTYETGLV